MPLVDLDGTIVVVRTRNHYVGAAVASVATKSINSYDAIMTSLNRLRLYAMFGTPHMVVYGDNSSIDIATSSVKFPVQLYTAWMTGLDVEVDSREGAKSVAEYRHYTRNPMAKLSVLIPVTGRKFRVLATRSQGDAYAMRIVRELGLVYASVEFIEDETGRRYVLSVDPIPNIGNNFEAEIVAEAIAESV